MNVAISRDTRGRVPFLVSRFAYIFDYLSRDQDWYSQGTGLGRDNSASTGRFEWTCFRVPEWFARQLIK